MSYRRTTIRGLVVTRLRFGAWTVHSAHTPAGVQPYVRRFRSRRDAIAYIHDVYA